MRSKISLFWIKLTNWEYWPWYIVYIPIFVYWLYCGIKTRAIFWISAVNPGFEYGGILGSSKNTILRLLPERYVPRTILVGSKVVVAEVLTLLNEAGLDFPMIIKPDIGERGFHVQLIQNILELENYLSTTSESHLIQEYLDMPIELGVFYYRFPNRNKGVVSSIVKKEMLKVTGNGILTIRELMAKNSRAVQQINRLESEKKIDLNAIPDDKEEVLLEPIGNHVRGTKFLNANHLISGELTDVFDHLAKEIEGFYYGRFDLRCESIESLNQGIFKVLEVNGAASEPAHIYSPGYPMLKGYNDLFHHWRNLYRISVLNHQAGVNYMTFKVGWAALMKSRFVRS